MKNKNKTQPRIPIEKARIGKLYQVFWDRRKWGHHTCVTPVDINTTMARGANISFIWGSKLLALKRHYNFRFFLYGETVIQLVPNAAIWLTAITEDSE